MPTSLPELPSDAALLLDLDGTLLDIAPTPDAVVVPVGLPEVLTKLRGRLADAVAIVTGRPVEQIDALLPGIPYAVAGEHGGAIRYSPGGALDRPTLPFTPERWLAAAADLAAAHPGVLLEPKAHGFVIHFRLAPDRGPVLRDRLAALLAASPELADGYVMMGAHMAWEVKPRGVDKGRAVDALMGRAPFASRRPIYIGDDVTDEDGMVAARRHGGIGLRVQEVFGQPSDVRDWLASMAERAR